MYTGDDLLNIYVVVHFDVNMDIQVCTRHVNTLMLQHTICSVLEHVCKRTRAGCKSKALQEC